MLHGFFIACLLLMSLIADPAGALSLGEALRIAATEEPSLLASVSAVDVADSRIAQNKAGYYPVVNATANSTRNHRDYVTRDTGDTQDTAFNSNAHQFTITQPLIKPALRPGLEQARRAKQQAEWQSENTRNEVLVKTTQAWLEIQIARAQHRAAVIQAHATQMQLSQYEGGMARGLSSAPQVDEARAKHLQALTDAQVARHEEAIKVQLLDLLVGKQASFAGDERRILNTPLQSANVDTLDCPADAIATAHPSVLAARASIEASRQEIEKQKAGHLPTLDLVGNVGRNAQTTGNFPQQPGYFIAQNSVGLQANFPIYAGGAVNAKIREASATLARSEHELTGILRQVLTNHQVARLGRESSEFRLKAASEAMKAALSNLRMETDGMHRGIKSEVDRLLSLAKLANARRDFERAGFEWFIQHTKALAACGSIQGEQISKAFEAVFVAMPELPLATKSP